MKREIGLSIYPDHSDPLMDQDYLKKAAALGYSRLFMSMLEVSEGKETVKKKFSSIIGFAKNLGFETILDISPAVFSDLAISYDDLSFFAELGADGIRLDQGFDGNKEAQLTFNPFGLAIELNMSNDVNYLENILSYQANEPFLYGCHNFYPQRGTGLTDAFFRSCSQRFKKYGLKTAAFITSQSAKIGPWEVNDGLPTLESCRDLPLALQGKLLFASGLIDTVIIGNAYASDAELKALAAIDRYKLTFGVLVDADASEIERRILAETNHFRRGDSNALVARSTQSRVKYRPIENLPHTNQEPFAYGDIVIGNDTFGQYKNELQIVLTPHQDTRKNKVGAISNDELPLLEYLKPWTKFAFELLD